MATESHLGAKHIPSISSLLHRKWPNPDLWGLFLGCSGRLLHVCHLGRKGEFSCKYRYGFDLQVRLQIYWMQIFSSFFLRSLLRMQIIHSPLFGKHRSWGGRAKFICCLSTSSHVILISLEQKYSCLFSFYRQKKRKWGSATWLWLHS